MNRTASILVALSLAASAARAQSPLDEKVRMEKDLTAEISSILDKFVGPGKSHVNVLMGMEIRQLPGPGQAPADKGPKGKDKQEKEKKQPSTNTRWLWKDINSKQKMAVLPGFTVAPEVTMSEQKEKREDPKPQAAPDDKKADARPEPVYVMEVKNVQVSVILDQSVSDKQVKMAEVMISEIAGLDPERGDKLNVYKLPLLSAWQWMIFTPTNMSSIFWISVWVVVAAVLLWLLMKYMVRVLKAFGVLPLRKHLPQPLQDAAKPEGEGEVAAGAVLGAEGNGDGADPDAPIQRKLEFVNGENVKTLAELLERCDAREVACVVGFLDAGLASQILEHFRPEKRLDVLWLLSWAKSLTPEALDKVKGAWKERLEHAYGGTDVVGELLSTMDQGLQNTFLLQLESKAPELSHRVRKALVRFEDLFDLRDSDLSLLGQAVPFKDWAMALADLQGGYASKLMAVLPDGSKTALQQWLSLTTANNGQSAQARAKILNAARGMQREGRISLHKTASRSLS